jgi:hypothetical protein
LKSLHKVRLGLCAKVQPILTHTEVEHGLANLRLQAL